MNPLDRLTEELAKLPGIGRRTALRLALHIIRQPRNYSQALVSALTEAQEKIRFCSACHHFTDEADPCRICQDARRDQHLLCVVEESSDLLAVERSRGYHGLYHVLHGSLSPIDGIGPDQLRLEGLTERIRQAAIREVILAMSSTVTGDATALYVSRLLQPMNIRITKLASGLPIGSDIEYIDSLTLLRAMEGRVEYR